MPLASRKGLLVQTDSETSQLIEAELASDGFSLSITQSGQDAIHQVIRGDFDFVVLSQKTVDLSGLEVLKALRATHSPISLPIVLLSESKNHEFVSAAFAAGANDCLEGSLQSKTLIARMKAVTQLNSSLPKSVGVSGLSILPALWSWDLETNTIHANSMWHKIFHTEGTDEAAMPLEAWFSRVHHDDIANLTHGLYRLIEGDSKSFQCEYRLHLAEGVKWVQSHAILDEAAQPQRLIGFHIDAFHPESEQEHWGTTSRIIFYDRLTQELSRQARHPERLAAVVSLEVEDFKLTLETSQTLELDEYIPKIVDALVTSSSGDRHSGPTTISYVGDDKFLVLLTDIKDERDVLHQAKRIQTMFREPADFSSNFYFNTCLGIAITEGQYVRAEDVVRDANVALSRAKKQTKKRIQLYDAKMQSIATEWLQLERELKQAIQNDELMLEYQPIVNLETGAVSHFEALVRWHHPKNGIMLPGKFLPQAEEFGLIVDIDRWVMKEVCRQLQMWQKAELLNGAPVVSLNFSSQGLERPDFISSIADIIRQYEVDPSWLHLELTETSLIDHTQEVEDLFEAIHQLGIGISLDDFGTGYSSLNYLYRFPTDVLKIDRCFISQLDECEKSQKIVRATIVLAHNLDIPVVAEGIETPRQLKQLRIMGCDYGQGFYFAKSLDPNVAIQLLSNPFEL